MGGQHRCLSHMGWDAPSKSSAPLCWKTQGDGERLFQIQLTPHEAPWAQRGKLRQGTRRSQAHPQHQWRIQALSIPQVPPGALW